MRQSKWAAPNAIRSSSNAHETHRPVPSAMPRSSFALLHAPRWPARTVMLTIMCSTGSHTSYISPCSALSPRTFRSGFSAEVELDFEENEDAGLRPQALACGITGSPASSRHSAGFFDYCVKCLSVGRSTVRWLQYEHLEHHASPRRPTAIGTTVQYGLGLGGVAEDLRSQRAAPEAKKQRVKLLMVSCTVVVPTFFYAQTSKTMQSDETMKRSSIKHQDSK
ncbi:hypothetical protein V8E36_002436 [Tilletia maclaganii]